MASIEVPVRVKKPLEDWEKAVEKFVNDAKKAGATASVEMDKRFKEMQTQGTKVAQTLQEQSKEADKNMRAALTEMDKRVKVAQDKMSRAWKELQK